MLQALREKTSGWFATIILASVGIPFAFFGVNSYFQTRTETFVAKIDKTEIDSQRFRTRLEQYRSQAREQQGAQFDPNYFNDPVVKRQILDRMVDEELLVEAAERGGGETSAGRLKKEIEGFKPFQVEGKFDLSQYKLLLASRQMTPRSFEEQIRRDLETRELPGEIQATAPVSDAEIDAYVKLRDQTRDMRWFQLTAPADAGGAAPTDDEIDAYYKAHGDDYSTPEQVAIEYVELDAKTLDVPSQPDDATLKARYEEEKKRFTVAEQRQASHILVKVAKGADAAAQKAAQAKAADLAAQARAGKDFAELAKNNSDDLGSKAQGGDLGWLEPGTLGQKAFEEKLFAMQSGEVSDPVLTDEGYHVIKLVGVKPGSQKTFEEVKADLAKEYADSEREKHYTDLSSKLIDKVYEDPTQLEPAANALGLKTIKTGLFTRNAGVGIASNPAVLKKAFSDAVLVEGNVSDAIELGPNHIVLIRIAEHKPKAPRPLAEVKDPIAARIRSDRMVEAVKAHAEEVRKQVAAGSTLDQLAQGAKIVEAKGLGRRAVNQDPTIVAEGFKLPRPSGDKPSLAVANLPGNRYAVIEVAAVTDGDPKKLDAAARDAVRQELKRTYAAAEVRGLIDALRARAKIKIAEDRM